MGTKKNIRLCIDLMMTVLLLCLMAYQVTGELWHEWCGAGMLVLFLLHNFLNLRWYRGLLRGRYTPVRIFHTAVNLLLLAAILCMAYSGIVLSRHVFAFLPITSGMALARRMHLAGSYWSFVLMSLHIGLHLGMMLGMLRRRGGTRSAWVLRILAAAAVVYGWYCCVQNGLFSYLFLRVEFAFFDYEKSAALVFAEHLAMMAAWAWLAYALSKCLAGRKKQPKG